MPVAVVNTGIFNNPFVLGATMPDSTNTGYGVLGYQAADLLDIFPASPYVVSITANGTVLQGQRIHGIVEISANNVTVQGCEIVGHLNIPYPGTTHYGLISSSGTGNVIQYNSLTQFDPSTSTDNSAGGNGTLDTYWMVGVLMTGGSCTVHRNNIHDCNDLVYTTGGTHTVSGNFLHDPMFRNDDQDQSGNAAHPYWSHNDGFQVMGGTGHQVIGNNFVMKFSDLTGMNRSGVGAGFGAQGTGNPNPSTTAEQQWPNCHGIIYQNAKNALSGVVIQQNWFKYATNAIFLGGAQTFDPGTVPAVTGNRFTPDQGAQFSQYVQISVNPTSAWTGPLAVDSTNVYSFDSDTPTSPVSYQGQPLNAPATPAGQQIWAFNISAHTGNVPLSLTSP